MFFSIYAAQCDSLPAEVKMLPVGYVQRPLCHAPDYTLSYSMVKKMLEDGLIVVSSKGEFIEVAHSGRACEALYLIKDGGVNRYVLKETRDPDEQQGIIDARELWPYGMLSKEGYSLVLAFHENLWVYEDENENRHYLELLHVARGSQLNDYLTAIFSSLFVKGNILNKETFQREVCGADELLGDYVTRTSEEPFVRVTTSTIVPNSSMGNLELNWGKVQEAIEAYKAFGIMIGALFAQYSCLDEVPPLDIHDCNVFYDPSTKTITLVDLQKLGEALRQQKKQGLHETLRYVFERTPLLNKDELNEFFFAGIRLLYGIKPYRFKWNKIDKFMELENCPEFPYYHPTRVAVFRFLNYEFNSMWGCFSKIRKAFADGLISNFSRDEDIVLLREEFGKFGIEI